MLSEANPVSFRGHYFSVRIKDSVFVGKRWALFFGQIRGHGGRTTPGDELIDCELPGWSQVGTLVGSTIFSSSQNSPYVRFLDCVRETVFAAMKFLPRLSLAGEECGFLETTTCPSRNSICLVVI